MHRPHLSALLATLLVLLAGCDSSNGSHPDPPPPEGRSLVARAVGESADDLAAQIRQGRFFDRVLPRLEGWEARVTTEDDRGDGDEIQVVAGLLPWPAAEALRAKGLPVDLAAAVVTLAGTPYDDPRVTLAFRLPGTGNGPERWLVAGTDPEAVANEVNRTLMRAAGVRFWGQRTADDVDYAVRESSYVLRTGTWSGGDARDDFVTRAAFLGSLRPVDPDSRGVRLLVPSGLAVDGLDLSAVAQELDRGTREMARSISGGEGLLAEPVTVAVEPDFVSQGRHTGALGPAVAGGASRGVDLHAVLHPEDLWGVRFRLARHLLERAGFGDDTPVWLADGAALVLSGHWYGRPWRDWLPVLAAAGALPDPEDAPALLAASRTADASEPLWTPAAAAVVEAMPGDDLATKLRAAARATPEDLARVLASLADRAPRAPTPPAERPWPEEFLAGVSFAMVNDLEGGYHAPSIVGELDRLADLGANAVSLMPFAYQANPRSPELRFLNDSPSSETDAGLVHATRVARERGFTVLSKPHIWLPGSWPGEVEMTTPAHWDAWWRSYRRYVLHHALLAAYAGAELFSVGVELEKTVGQQQRWERLVADVERLFPGPVVYAANWYRGAETATFWDRLDAVGVDAYYPLYTPGEGETEDPSDAELAAGARQAVAKLQALARRTGKPVVLTEVGFAARRHAWDEPHREGGELSVDDQAASYRALFGALDEADGDWLRGVFVWKAFSGPRRWRGVAEDAGQPDFRFLDRPAEGEIRRYFSERGPTGTSDREQSASRAR